MLEMKTRFARSRDLFPLKERLETGAGAGMERGVPKTRVRREARNNPVA